MGDHHKLQQFDLRTPPSTPSPPIAAHARPRTASRRPQRGRPPTRALARTPLLSEYTVGRARARVPSTLLRLWCYTGVSPRGCPQLCDGNEPQKSFLRWCRFIAPIIETPSRLPRDVAGPPRTPRRTLERRRARGPRPGSRSTCARCEDTSVIGH